MKKHFSITTLLVIMGLLLIAAALASCAPDTSAPELKSEIAQTESTDEQANSDTASTSNTSPGDEIDRVQFTDQACLDCHTDEVRLQELAVEEEETESLSEGPG